MERERKKVLTISIAAYQVEEYLEETLESFRIPEVMEELEVLIINDGSTDRTAQIAAEYQQKYPETFRLIDKKNGGHGSTVNRGIEEAAGKYFKTVDGDDWVDREGLKELMAYLRGADEDMVVTDYLWMDHTTGKTIKKISCAFSEIRYGFCYRFADICDRIYINMHGMTYRTELLKKHPPMLDEHCFYVDAEYVLLPVLYADTVAFLEKPVYMYRLGLENQSMNIRSMQKNCGHHERVLERLLLAYEQFAAKAAGSGKEAKRRYLAKGIARIAASQIKIYLSFPTDKQWKVKIMELERRLKENYPEVYRQTENKAVWGLRKSRYMLYRLASRVLRCQF